MLKNDRYFKKGQKLLLMFSGGLDSTALFMMLLELKREKGIDFSCFHLNHKLRETADRDQQFCEQMCKKHAIEIFTYVRNIRKLKGSTEQMARNVRYELVAELCKEYQFDGVLSAHHRDDQVETFFLNLFRGTGSTGLIGTPKIRDGIYRPLLEYSKEQLEDYLQKRQVDYVEDETNFKNEYTRNKIRNELISYLQTEYATDLTDKISRVQRNLFREKIALKELLYKTFDFKKHSFEISFLRQQSEEFLYIFVHELLQIHLKGIDVNEKQHDQLVQMIRMIDSGDFKIRDIEFSIESGWLWIKKNSEKEEIEEIKEVNIILEQGMNHFTTFDCQLEFTTPRYSKWTYSIPISKVKGDLRIRSRRPGDRMLLKGVGHKKIKDILIDQKVPRSKRSECLLLCDDKRIYWLIGYKKADVGQKETDEKHAVISIYNYCNIS